MPVSIMLDAGHGGRDPELCIMVARKDDVLKLVYLRSEKFYKTAELMWNTHGQQIFMRHLSKSNRGK